MTYKTLKVETDGDIGIISINRPKALNALSLEVLTELMNAIVDVQFNNSEVKGIILTGEGDKAFVAGADIPSMQGMTALQADEFVAIGHKCMRMIETADVPVIAAVNGFALGGGCELALACDFIYASSNAKLGLPEVTLGLFPGFGGTQRLARAIGSNRAKELIFTGDVITADRAYELGIVNKVCEQADLMTETKAVMKNILAKAPVAVRMAKQVINEGTDLPLASGLNLEKVQFPIVFATEDTQEGVAAFLEKRKPNFQGR